MFVSLCFFCLGFCVWFLLGFLFALLFSNSPKLSLLRRTHYIHVAWNCSNIFVPRKTHQNLCSLGLFMSCKVMLSLEVEPQRSPNLLDTKINMPSPVCE